MNKSISKPSFLILLSTVISLSACVPTGVKTNSSTQATGYALF